MVAIAASLAYSYRTHIDHCQNGIFWAFVHEAANTLRPKYSSDGGVTWQNSVTPFSETPSDCSIFIDIDDYAHVLYRHSGGNVRYVRGTPNAGRTDYTWSAPQTVDSGTSGAGMADVVAHREGTGWKVHCIYHYNTGVGPYSEVYYRRINVAADGTLSFDIASTRIAGNYGIDNAPYPSLDFHHNGDGKTVKDGTPNLYVAMSPGTTGASYGIRFLKASYSAGTWTWGTERQIDANHYMHRNATPTWLMCRFDGTRVLIGGELYNASSQLDLMVWERDVADTTTTQRVAVLNLTGSDRMDRGSLTYDAFGNIHLIGQPDSTGDSVWYYKWDRGTSTLSAKARIGSTAFNATSDPQWRRGHRLGILDFLYSVGNQNPYQINYDKIEPLAAGGRKMIV